MVFTGDGRVGRRRVFHRGKKTILRTKQIPWKMVDRGAEPSWARETRCRRKPGRMSAGELELKRSSVVVSSKKAEGLLVVWVRVKGGAKKLGRVVSVALSGGEGSGCCPRAGGVAREAVEGAVFAKGADEFPEIPAMRRFREGLR